MADAYSPSFSQPPKGKYNVNGAFIALKGGSDAYLLENELSELQWIQIQERARSLNGIFGSGVVPTVTKAKNLIELIATNKIKVNHSVYLVAGHYFEIPETTIDLGTANYNNYDIIYIDFAFKEIAETGTVVKDGNMNNSSTTIPNYMIDSRINVSTSRRIQKQFYVNSVKNKASQTYANLICSFTNTAYTSWENHTSYEKGDFAKIQAGNCVALTDGGYILGYPIVKVKRTSGSNITENDIELLAVDVQGLNNEEFEQNVEQQITNLDSQLANLTTIVNNLQVEKSFYEKYGLYMNAPTYLYQGNNTAITATITGYDMSNDHDYLFQLSSMGNNYAAQIGEIWSQYTTNYTAPDMNKLKIYSSGTSNVMFMVNHFRKENNEIAYAEITSAGNSTAKNIALSNGFNKNISSWGLQNNCIVCVQPVYESTQTFNTTPSIGDIWIDDSNSSNLVVYNSGSAGIHLQVFVIKVNNANLQLNTFNCNGSNLVENAFGKHYEFITTVGVNFVMLGTPIKRTNQTTVPDIGEIYVISGEDQYMVSTTSNGTGVYLKALVFKR